MARPSNEVQASTSLTDRLLAVPKATIVDRMTEHCAASAANPRKRGPKPKLNPPDTHSFPDAS